LFAENAISSCKTGDFTLNLRIITSGALKDSLSVAKNAIEILDFCKKCKNITVQSFSLLTVSSVIVFRVNGNFSLAGN
jgi:hypothetical protein